MLNRHFPRRQPAICLSGPTNTVDAGQISSFPAVFQPPASKANRKGDWITLPGGRWRVCRVVYTPGSRVRPTWSRVPIRRFPPFAVLGPPACTASAYSDSRLPTITRITAWGKRAHACHFLRLCVYSPSRLIVMILSHATDQRHFVGNSADELFVSPSIYPELVDPF